MPLGPLMLLLQQQDSVRGLDPDCGPDSGPTQCVARLEPHACSRDCSSQPHIHTAKPCCCVLATCHHASLCSGSSFLSCAGRVPPLRVCRALCTSTTTRTAPWPCPSATQAAAQWPWQRSLHTTGGSHSSRRWGQDWEGGIWKGPWAALRHLAPAPTNTSVQCQVVWRLLGIACSVVRHPSNVEEACNHPPKPRGAGSMWCMCRTQAAHRQAVSDCVGHATAQGCRCP